MSFLFGTQQPTANTTSAQNINKFADELKAALLNVGKEAGTGRLIGVDLGSKAAFQSQVNDLISSIKSSYIAYSSELGKAAKIRDLNKNLVSNFSNNLQVMVDVTQLLRSYIQLFEVMKEELKKINALIGKEAASLEEIDYLKELTEKRVQELQGQFNDQSKFLKEHYGTLGMLESSKNLEGAKVDEIMRAAQDIVSSKSGGTNVNDAIRKYNGGKGKKGKKTPKAC